MGVIKVSCSTSRTMERTTAWSGQFMGQAMKPADHGSERIEQAQALFICRTHQLKASGPGLLDKHAVAIGFGA